MLNKGPPPPQRGWCQVTILCPGPACPPHQTESREAVRAFPTADSKGPLALPGCRDGSRLGICRQMSPNVAFIAITLLQFPLTGAFFFLLLRIVCWGNVTPSTDEEAKAFEHMVAPQSEPRGKAQTGSLSHPGGVPRLGISRDADPSSRLPLFSWTAQWASYWKTASNPVTVWAHGWWKWPLLACPPPPSRFHFISSIFESGLAVM